MILKELIPMAQAGSSYICITRPRRFGKTVMANMIASFFSKGEDSRALFDGLKISEFEGYGSGINQHNVIHIQLNETPADCRSWKRYISRICDRLLRDLKRAYPQIEYGPEEAIAQIKKKKYALRFLGKLGEEQKYTGRILAVGIGYDRKTKKHSCRIEVLR